MKVLKATFIKKLDIALWSDAVIFSKNIFFPHTINYRLASCLASNANHTYLTTHPKFNPIYTQIRVYLMLISHMAAAGEEEGVSGERSWPIPAPDIGVTISRAQTCAAAQPGR